MTQYMIAGRVAEALKVSRPAITNWSKGPPGDLPAPWKGRVTGLSHAVRRRGSGSKKSIRIDPLA